MVINLSLTIKRKNMVNEKLTINIVLTMKIKNMVNGVLTIK